MASKNNRKYKQKANKDKQLRLAKENKESITKETGDNTEEKQREAEKREAEKREAEKKENTGKIEEKKEEKQKREEIQVQKHPILKKMLGFTAILLLVILVGILGISIRNNGYDILKYRPVVVVSGSMEPKIMTNSIALMKYCNIEEIEEGNIVVYRNTERNINVIHRVIEINNTDNGEVVLKTKGDANEEPDDIEVTDEMLVGKVVSIYNELVPYVEFLLYNNGNLNIIHTIQVLIFGVVVLAIIIVVLRNICSYLKVMITVYNKKKFQKEALDYCHSLQYLINRIKEVKNCKHRKKDWIRKTIAKMILMHAVKNLQDEIEEFDSSYRMAMFIGGKGFKEQCNVEVTENK